MKKVLAIIALLAAVSCATLPAIGYMAAKDLGYMLVRHYAGVDEKVATICDIANAKSDPAVMQAVVKDALQRIWTEANDQDAQLLVCNINEVVGLMGLDTPPTAAKAERWRKVIQGICEGAVGGGCTTGKCDIR